MITIKTQRRLKHTFDYYTNLFLDYSHIKKNEVSQISSFSPTIRTISSHLKPLI
jgi:hypothetical protein